MYVWDDLPKKDLPPRKGIKPVGKRTVTEDCEYGDVVEFPMGAPNIRIGSDVQVAPSSRGVVSMFITGAPFVRFELGGSLWSEPFCVERNQPITRLRGYR